MQDRISQRTFQDKMKTWTVKSLLKIYVKDSAYPYFCYIKVMCAHSYRNIQYTDNHIAFSEL